MSTTYRNPARTYSRYWRIASCCERFGRNPKLYSEKVWSQIWVRTCITACWITLSSTVGIPNKRTPPGLGISFRRTGMGVYVPSINAFRIFVQWRLRYLFILRTVMPSTPGAPSFLITRFIARLMLFRSRIDSMSRVWPVGLSDRAQILSSPWVQFLF